MEPPPKEPKPPPADDEPLIFRLIGWKLTL
jgi:hypothetical protein